MRKYRQHLYSVDFKSYDLIFEILKLFNNQNCSSRQSPKFLYSVCVVNLAVSFCVVNLAVSFCKYLFCLLLIIMMRHVGMCLSYIRVKISQV